MKKKVSTEKLMITLTVTTIAIHIVLSFMISSRITSPIRTLRDKLHKLENGDIKKAYYKNANNIYIKDDIWQIGLSFDNIVLQLNNYIQNEYDYKLKANEAKLLALQSQINPHFLYNALETINSISIINNVPMITDITHSLAKMFRYNTDQKLNVPVKSELYQLNDYLTVQTIRFNDLVTYEINVQREMHNFEMLKFTLQPIVENCFIHGFKNLSNNALIFVNGYQKDDKLIFQIKDNGEGLTEEKINKLNMELLNDGDSSIYNRHINKQRIGIFNVHQRIRLHYGKEYGLFLESNEPNGLIVWLILPKVEYNLEEFEKK